MSITRNSESSFEPHPLAVLAGDDCAVPTLTPSQPLIMTRVDGGGFTVAPARALLETALSVKEVMEALGYRNATSFMQMARRENLPFFKINSSVYRFPVAGVNDWLRRRSTMGPTGSRRVNLGGRERRQSEIVRLGVA